MIKKEWTEGQKNAMNARGGPLLVSAAAGSGKTEVLVQRIIKIITDPDNPTDIDRFLVVTFTKAAAGEMKQRISQALTKLLENDPFNKRLLEQQLLLPKAQISTIDSFCSTLVKEYFYTLELPADFRIIDDDEKELLRGAALDKVLDDMYSENDEEFERLAEAFSGSHDDDALRSMVLKIHRYLDSQPFPKTWAEKIMNNYGAEGAKTPWDTVWGEEIKEYISGVLDHAEKFAAKAFESAHSVAEFDKAQLLTERECGYIDEIKEMIRENKWDEIGEYLSKLLAYFSDKKASNLSFKGATKEPNKSISKMIRAYRKAYKKPLTDDLPVIFGRSSADFFDEIEQTRPMVTALLRVTLRFIDEYQKMKAERSAADYADLEHWTLDLLVKETEDGLVPTDEAREIAKRYDYVMVDEYQDANAVQDIIFKAVSDDDKRLFVVGDVKQSIYSFRLAMPEIFIKRKDASAPYKADDEHYPSRINLDANFRSRKGVTECVNFIFRNVMSREVGGIDYNDEESLDPKASYPEEDAAACSFHLIGTGDAKNDEKIAAEARYIGGLIEKMLHTETVYEDEKLRKPLYSDFCILMRSDKDTSVVYIEELMKMGIPAVSEKGGNFFDRPEIRLMMSLLRTLDNPARDIPLAAVLLSPLVGFTFDELALLRAGRKDVGLYEILLAESEENEKAARAAALITRLRECGNNITSDELIRRIYNETLLPEIVLSGDDGEYRRKNLRLLLEYAKKYEGAGFKGLSGFIGYLDRLKESEKGLSTAARSGETVANAVKIMSIHRSKGLQFPFCFVSNLGTRFNKTDISDKIVLHGKMGVGMNVIDSERMFSYKGIIRETIENSMTVSLVSEELRMLYVAMTRAKERLILTASVQNPASTLKKAAGELVYDGAVPSYLVKRASGMLGILLYCMLLSKSGDELREAAGFPANEDGTPSLPTDPRDETRWDIKIVGNVTADEENSVEAAKENTKENGDISDVTIDAEEQTEAPICFTEEEAAQALEVIKKRFERKKNYPKEYEVPMKVTASAVAEKESGETFAAQSKPSFMRSGTLTGADRGTAHHRFAECCDFEKARADLEAEKQRLVNSGKLTREQEDCIQNAKVERFLHSELMEEMLAAQLLEREYTFMTEIPAGLADKTLTPPDSEAKIILQGSIDCLFELNGELVIVDYKTDFVQTADELAIRYSRQLELYKYAAEQIFQKEVTRCVLWSFCLGEEIELDIS